MLRVSNEMVGKREVIGPEAAERSLANQRTNRRINTSRVKAMCSDRVHGRWRLSHQGIAYDASGRLIDGQHRLQMVIATQMPTEFFVVRGVPEDAIVHIDEIRPRSVSDALLMGGFGEYGNATVAAMRAFLLMPGSSNTYNAGYISREMYIKLLDAYGEAIAFACEQLSCRGRGVTRATRALIARAFYHLSNDVLVEFCSFIANGSPVASTPRDGSAIRFASYIKERSVAGDVGHFHEVRRYRMGQSALQAFNEGRSLSVLRETKQDLYPLPEGVLELADATL